MLVEQMTPHVVFPDFDRTLASTKGGANPMQGSHSVDSDLAAMAATHAGENVHVVTRNSNKDAIEQFLQLRGVPVAAVHSVKQDGFEKADVICDETLLPPGERGIFVDDDIAECTADRIREHPFLLRVLFVRGL